MPAVCSLENVYKFHGPAGAEAPVLQDAGFELEAGEFLCVMGPSGAGKSTLLHLLAGLDEPSAGKVHLAGKVLAELSGKERTRLRRDTVGFVFQFFNLLPNLTVFENVSLPVAIRGGRPQAERERVAALLERFGIAHRADALPHELSGGQMQHASIARALCGDQPVLLCDEPTGNLSQQAGRQVMETLRRICDEDKKSVLLVTHNPRDAACADRVLFLVDGKIDPEHQLSGPDIPVERVHEALAALEI